VRVALRFRVVFEKAQSGRENPSNRTGGVVASSYDAGMEERVERPEQASCDLGHVSRLRARLLRLRARARALLLARGAARIVGVFVPAMLILGLCDYFLRLPAALRVGIWVAGIVVLVQMVRRLILPAIRFCPSLSDLALRVESSSVGRADGLLASALELDPSDPRSREAVLRARERLDAIGPWHVLEPARSRTVLSAGMASLLGVVLLAALMPTLSLVGAQRLLLPMSSANWPQRTLVVDSTQVGAVHPLGVALDLSATLTRSARPAGQTRVVAMVRMIRDGTHGETVRLPMSAQGETDIYQRRVETSVEGDTEVALEYWFEADDGASEPRRVLLVATPEVAHATLSVQAPSYARRVLAGSDLAFVGRRDLGQGLDERAIAGPMLAGSTFEFDLRLTKPLASLAPGSPRPRWLDDLCAQNADCDVELAGDRVTVRGVLRASARVEVSLRDEHGLVNALPSAFHFDVVDDAPPVASVARPAHDESVLASAVVEIAGEASDDLALDSIALERVIARPPAGSQGAPPETDEGTREVIARRSLDGESPASRRRAQLTHELDLGDLALRPGDEVQIRALARDVFDLDGARHETSASSVRRLTIIDEAQMVERLRRDLDAIRDAAQRLDEAQARVERQLARLGAGEGLRQQQGAIAEQIGAQREAAERIGERMRRNRLADPALAGLIEDARGALDAAQEAAGEAEQRMSEAGEGTLDPEDARAIERAQREVRDELGRLAEMLSRGQDEWLMRRDVERLLQEQRRLAEQTASIGRRTAGRDASELTLEELSELDRIAQRQREASEQLEQTLDDLNERARQMSEADPAQASAMQQAADRGRRSQAAQAMREAAQQVQENQTGAAGRSQQEAMDALEEMLEDLESAQANRDAALRRVLASVIESIDGLIRQQEREIAALDAAQDLRGLDQGMVRLMTNTLGVLDQVRSQGEALASVADLLDDAIDAQQESIGHLRQAEIDPNSVRVGEETSLDLLKEARREAQRLEEEAGKREAARKQAELRKAYREALEQQVAIRGEVAPMAGQRLTRRQRQRARVLGEQQETLRQRLGEIRDQTEELEQSEMFAFAHERLDGLMSAAGDALRRGAPTPGTLRRQDSAVRLLQSILESLKDQQSEDDPFRDAASSSGGGQGGSGDQPLIPPMAELKLLRSMQEEALAWTRALDESDGASEEELAELAELQAELAEKGAAIIQKMSEQQQQRRGLEQMDKEGSR